MTWSDRSHWAGALHNGVHRVYVGLLRSVVGGAACLRFHPKSLLRTTGWLRSFRLGRSVDRVGDAIPWNPYCFIRFIEPRLKKDFRVFEYGCGASTIWYSRRVAEIIAVEHDAHWRDRIAPRIVNGSVIHCPIDGRYVEEACNAHGEFDIVIIDGQHREECAIHAVKAVSARGCIVWDDSQEKHFQQAYPPLREAGWREISFWGLKPSEIVPGQTSILYRNGNCLGI